MSDIYTDLTLLADDCLDVAEKLDSMDYTDIAITLRANALSCRVMRARLVELGIKPNTGGSDE